MNNPGRWPPSVGSMHDDLSGLVQRFSSDNHVENSLHHHHPHHHHHHSDVIDHHLHGGQQINSQLSEHHVNSDSEPTHLYVEGLLMRLLAQSPDGTLMCCANDTQLKFVDSRFLKLYETNTPGPILAACFHPHKYELFLKIHGRTLIFDLATKEYRTPEEHDAPIPSEPWVPPPPPQGAMLQQGGVLNMQSMAMSNDKRRSGSGRPKGSKDKAQRKPRSAAAQEFEKEVVMQLTSVCGDDSSKWNAKKGAIDAVKGSPLWDTWTKAGLNEQQLVQFVHRLKAKRMCGKEMGSSKPMGVGVGVEMPQMSHPSLNQGFAAMNQGFNAMHYLQR